MHRLGTFVWSTAPRRIGLLVGLALVFFVLVPATAFSSKRARNIICSDNPLIKSFSPHQGTGGTLVEIRGKHLNNADNVWFSEREDSLTSASFSIHSGVITAQVPNDAWTGKIYVGNGSSCGLNGSIKSFVVN